MPCLFLHDPVSGETLDYDALAAAVLGERLRYRPYCRPSRLSEAFFAIAIALAADRNLTLVDDGLTERELADLGLDAATLRTEEQLASPRQAHDLESWLAAVRTDCRSRLTLFTSGSTGLPKAVRHALPDLCRGVRAGGKHSVDVWGFAYNPTHMAGVQVFLQALFNLNPLVNLFRLPRETVVVLLREHRVTHLSATPSFYRLLLPAETAMPDVRAVTLGGERTDASLLERLRPLFPSARFRNVYASTEAGSLLTADGDLFSIPEGLASRMVIRDGRLHLHRSLLGEFASPIAGRKDAHHGAHAGYEPTGIPLSHPTGEGRGEAARSADRDDWYDTGDVVEIVSESPLRFRFVGRDRDWVNVGGNKVNPAEVEAVLLEHPGVREARVFGRDNTVLGKVLCAEVVPTGAPVPEPELRELLVARLQAVKVPRVIRSVPALDLNRTGKLRRDG